MNFSVEILILQKKTWFLSEIKKQLKKILKRIKKTKLQGLKNTAVLMRVCEINQMQIFTSLIMHSI